jgi:hypothetical protein
MTRAHLLVVLALAGAPIAGCLDTGPAAASGGDIEVLLQGRDSFPENRTTIVAYDESNWTSQLTELWQAHHGPANEAPDVPDADLDGRMAIAHFQGSTQGGCQGVDITRVTQAADRDAVEVHVEVFTVEDPQLDCGASAPMQMATAPAVHGSTIEVVEETTTDDAVPEAWTDAFTANGSEDEETSRESGEGTAERTSLAFETLDRGGDSNLTERRGLAIRDQASWEAFWANHTREDRDRPNVDFDERMVVAVLYGPAPDGCHAVEIQKIEQTDGQLVAHAEEQVRDGACIQQVTYPFHVVELDQVDGELTVDWDEAS